MAAFSPGWAAFPLQRRHLNVLPCRHPGRDKIGSLDQAEPTVTLLEGDSSATYVSGHLLFAREETMMAQAFDPDTRQLSGDAVPVLDSVSKEGSRYVSASVSQNGTLVYAAGGSPNPLQLIWFNRSGAHIGTLGSGAGDIAPALSPDERQVAVALRTGSPPNLDVWTIEIARNLRRRVTTEPRAARMAGVVAGRHTHRVRNRHRRSSRAGRRRPRLVQALLNRTGANETLLEGAATPSRPCGPRTMRDDPVRLVRGRTVRAVHSQRDIPTGIGHLGAADGWRAQTVSR